MSLARRPLRVHCIPGHWAIWERREKCRDIHKLEDQAVECYQQRYRYGRLVCLFAALTCRIQFLVEYADAKCKRVHTSVLEGSTWDPVSCSHFSSPISSEWPWSRDSSLSGSWCCHCLLTVGEVSKAGVAQTLGWRLLSQSRNRKKRRSQVGSDKNVVTVREWAYLWCYIIQEGGDRLELA